MLRRSLGRDLLDEEPGADLAILPLFCDSTLARMGHCCQTLDFDYVRLVFNLSVRWYFTIHDDIARVDLGDISPLFIDVNPIQHVSKTSIGFNKGLTISNLLYFNSIGQGRLNSTSRPLKYS